MRRIKIAQIGASLCSHGVDIWDYINSHKELFDVVGYAFPENKRIALSPATGAPFATLCQFRVPCADGSFIQMVDYQSTGKTWDATSATEVWLPVG